MPLRATAATSPGHYLSNPTDNPKTIQFAHICTNAQPWALLRTATKHRATVGRARRFS
jgi:hypothetical protein